MLSGRSRHKFQNAVSPQPSALYLFLRYATRAKPYAVFPLNKSEYAEHCYYEVCPQMNDTKVYS